MGNPPTLHFGPQTPTNPTNSASVSSIPNGSAAGTSFGTLSTTLGGSPTFSIVYDGGHAVQAVGSSLEVLYAEPINIMYRRALQLSFQASGVVGGGIVNIPSLATVSIPATPTGGTTLAVTGIQGTLTATDLTLTAQNTGFEVATIVESGSATLTISSSVSSPTLREVNAGWPPETGTSNFVTQLTSTGVTPLQWSFLGQVLAIASGGYTSATGVIVLTMSQVVQSSLAAIAYSLTGTGAYASLDGTWPVISVSGSIVTLQGPTGAGAATITGGKIAIGQSPLEVHCYTGVVAMVGRCVYNSTGLGGAEGVNWWAGSNQVGLVRVQDSTGAWGTSEIACSVTQRSTLAQLSSDLPSCGLNDWSNITVSGANLLTAQLMLNGTNYTMVVPSGANPPQISTYVGPDGNTRNTCTYPGGQISLAIGAAYSGSGTGILASFNQSNIANTNGAVGSVVNVTSTLSFGGNITDSGGNGVSVDTQGGGYLEAHASNASGVALIGGAQHLTAGWNTMMSSSDGNTVIGEAGTFTGQNVLVNPTLGGTTPAGDFSNNPILPKTNSFTCSALTVDNTPYGQAWISGLDWFSTRGLLDYERDILYCYIARRWATGYTPAKCALSNAREPLLIINNWNQIAGTTVYRQGQFFQYYHDWDSSTGVGTVNGYDLGAYVNTDVAGVSDVWPERNGYVDNNGHFVSAVQEIYPHQRAWMLANPGNFTPAGGVNNVNGRAFGMDTRMSFGPYQGFWEVKFKLPAGQALAGVPMWAYNQSATAFELDQVEQYGNSNPSRSVFTAHAANGVQQGINYPMNDSSINFVWVTTDWYSLNDGSGNDAIELYVNRRLVTTVYNPSSLWPTPLFPYMSFTTGDGGYPVPNTYTPFGYVNGAMTVAAWNVLANPDTQISPGSVFAVAQLPAVQVQPAISGPRGGLLTCSTPTYKWGIYLYLSPTFQWYTWSDAAGFTAIAGATNNTYDDSGNLYPTNTLACAVGQQIYGPNFPWSFRAFIDPPTLPNMSLVPVQMAITAGSYVSGTGVITLTLPVSPGLSSGGANVTLSGLTGTGSVSALDGAWAPISGTTGTTLVLQGPTGQGSITITGGEAAYSLPGTTGAAQGSGVILGWLHNMARDAVVTIASSDTSGHCLIGPDNTQILPGANWHSLPKGTPVNFTVQQAGIQGLAPPLAQTFTITPN